MILDRPLIISTGLWSIGVLTLIGMSIASLIDHWEMQVFVGGWTLAFSIVLYLLPKTAQSNG